MRPINELWIYGDSLSTGTHGKNAYLDGIRERLPIRHITNFSVGSSGLTRKTPDSMISIVERQIKEGFPEKAGKPDIILIWHGTNDWYWGSSLDLYGREIDRVTGLLRSFAADSLLLWPTAVFRLEKPDGGEAAADAFSNPNKNGDTLFDFMRVLEAHGEQQHFPVIEIGKAINIHRYNETLYLEDHVHPNEKGYRKIANVLSNEMGKYWSYMA